MTKVQRGQVCLDISICMFMHMNTDVQCESQVGDRDKDSHSLSVYIRRDSTGNFFFMENPKESQSLHQKLLFTCLPWEG